MVVLGVWQAQEYGTPDRRVQESTGRVVMAVTSGAVPAG
jgi:hypothetical protein